MNKRVIGGVNLVALLGMIVAAMVQAQTVEVTVKLVDIILKDVKPGEYELIVKTDGTVVFKPKNGTIPEVPDPVPGDSLQATVKNSLKKVEDYPEKEKHTKGLSLGYGLLSQGLNKDLELGDLGKTRDKLFKSLLKDDYDKWEPFFTPVHGKLLSMQDSGEIKSKEELADAYQVVSDSMTDTPQAVGDRWKDVIVLLLELLGKDDYAGIAKKIFALLELFG